MYNWKFYKTDINSFFFEIRDLVTIKKLIIKMDLHHIH